MNNQKENLDKPIGTIADIESRVNIAEVHGGYFSDPEKAKKFISIGIEGIEGNFGTKIKYVDFGGGQGFLAQHVVNYLESHGHSVDAIVADANPNFLETAKMRGLSTELCNLESCKITDVDLITMRAVLHYNALEAQQKILANIFNALKDNGFLVHQFSSGSFENVALRSAIVNLRSLGRAHKEGNQYRFFTEQEYMEMVTSVGFVETKHVGYAPPNAWGPEEQWNRFNTQKLNDAKERRDEGAISQIEERKIKYLAEANKLVEEYLRSARENGSENELGVNMNEKGQYHIRYTYPIFVSKKLV